MDGEKKRRGPPSRYPWEEWFAKERFVLHRGLQFPESVQPHGMAQTIRNAAARHGLGVSISIFDRGLYVQTYPREKIRQSWNRRPDDWKSKDEVKQRQRNRYHKMKESNNEAGNAKCR